MNDNVRHALKKYLFGLALGIPFLASGAVIIWHIWHAVWAALPDDRKLWGTILVTGICELLFFGLSYITGQCYAKCYVQRGVDALKEVDDQQSGQPRRLSNRARLGLAALWVVVEVAVACGWVLLTFAAPKEGSQDFTSSVVVLCLVSMVLFLWATCGAIVCSLWLAKGEIRLAEQAHSA